MFSSFSFRLSEVQLLGSSLRRWWSRQAAALVLEPVALTSDLDDGRVMQDPVEQGGGERSVARERACRSRSSTTT